jgi:jumonji domain-containing protein 2
MGGDDIPGVTKPYIYVGSWRSLFGWHKEDLDLESINYLHVGQPKFWYSVDLDSNEDFENLAKMYFDDLHRECPEFLRHKTTLIEPDVLLKNNIKMHKVVQRPGEFIVSRASAYHSGFNAGFNIAEAVNFALPTWIPVAREAGYCRCEADSVRINMDVFEKRLRGECLDSDEDIEGSAGSMAIRVAEEN